MNLNPYFKSVLDQDRASIVLCGLDHTILYMNPAAIRSYAKHGGAALVGRSLANCHNAHSNEMIQTVVDWFAASPEHNLIRINRITISAGTSGLLLSFCSAAVSCIMPQKASFSKTFCHKLPDFT